MTLYPIETGNFKLDGGAMFGVVPKVLWERTNPHAHNRIDMAARSLLIEKGNRRFLSTPDWAPNNLKNFLAIMPVGQSYSRKLFGCLGF